FEGVRLGHAASVPYVPMRLTCAAVALAVAACGGGAHVTNETPDASSEPPEAAAVAPAGAREAGPRLPVNSDAPLSLVEAETFLAVSGDTVVAVWIGIAGIGGTTAIGYRMSRDGGATWGAVKALASLGGRMASDPLVAADASGNFYASWVGFDLG